MGKKPNVRFLANAVLSDDIHREDVVAPSEKLPRVGRLGASTGVAGESYQIPEVPMNCHARHNLF